MRLKNYWAELAPGALAGGAEGAAPPLPTKKKERVGREREKERRKRKEESKEKGS